MTESVDLGPRLEGLVSHLVETGRFRTRTEVIQAGLRMIEEREEALQTLDALIEEGLAEAEAGQFVGSAELQSRLTSKYIRMPCLSDDV